MHTPATRRQFHLHALALGAAGLGLPALSRAQAGDFPSRPVKIIVPYAAGGGPDVLTRKMAPKFAEALGRGGVVVDNIVGAGGLLAAQQSARMPADGYTILQGSSSQIVQKAMQSKAQYDLLKDFVHITRTGFSPAVLIVSASAPWKTVEELVAAAKKEPGKLNYASGGMGSLAHLCCAAMVLQAGIDVVHVPYKGSVEIVPSLLSGATQFGSPIASTALPLLQSGRVRALAVTSAQRMAALPDVPTLAEVFKTQDLALVAWEGMWVPAGTPPAVVDVLFKAFTRTYADPAVRADAEAAGVTVSTSASPAEFTKFIEAETLKYDKLVKAARLSVTN